MAYPCVASCGRVFDKHSGLAKHQGSCREFAARDTKFSGLAEKFAKRQAAKPRKRRRVDESGEAEVSANASAGSQVEAVVPSTSDAVCGPPSPMLDIQVEIAEPSTVDPPPAVGRGMRSKRPTWKVLEQMPQPPPPPPYPIETAVHSPSSDEPTLPSHPSFVWQGVRTALNIFGIYREYPSMPSHSPDDTLSLDDMSYTAAHTPGVITGESRLSPAAAVTASSSGLITPDYAPFANMSVFRFMNWLWTGSHLKSIGEACRLLRDVILAPDFNAEDLRSLDVARETAKFDEHISQSSSALPAKLEDGWQECSVEIPVPDRRKHDGINCTTSIPTFTVPGLQHRSLVETIKAVWSDKASSHFHFTPFRQFWQRDADTAERIHDEVYASDAYANAYAEVQDLPAEPGCVLERTVCALMLWSDSTHLANFGTASLWPLYLFFGNQSKYARARPQTGTCHHLAYIPKLPDSFQDFYKDLTGSSPSDDVLTHCRRELMHAVLKHILDDDFLHAYEHGIVILCPDGVWRRVYPRILTYSADYPEKILLATIRNMGHCPCPRCKVPKTKMHELGMQRDETRRERDTRHDDVNFKQKTATARRAIHQLGRGVKSKAVEDLLADESYVPTENAFSNRLSQFGFDLFMILVVDLMHEFELGVWKAVFLHLIRILMVCGRDVVHELDKRYRHVPTFGRSTIRRFHENASAMKKLAARDFEDLLQCALPVFEGLLPEPHNKIVLDLLFALAEWHAEAKLRMHTDSSLALLSRATTYLGAQLRRFMKNTCSKFDTKELPREAAARRRRAENVAVDKSKKTTSSSSTPSLHPRRKQLNLSTYKLHSLGDYSPGIRFIGTTDSYSTQPGELEHRRVKRFYARTNKARATRQITRLQRREQVLTRMMRDKRVAPVTAKGRMPRKSITPSLSFEDSDPLSATPPEHHHHISHSRNYPVRLTTLMSSLNTVNIDAAADIIPDLHDHLLERILHPGMASEARIYTPEERLHIALSNDRVFMHKVFRVNYTSYDVQRGQDSMNARTHADIMTLSRDSGSDHPFSYARILGVFHADVLYRPPGSPPQIMTLEFLWVHWFRHDKRWKGGFKSRRLHRIGLLPEDEMGAFGFLDPDDVIRGAHLIPAFAHGRNELDTDWKYFYVNIFVDRDIFMRYAGIGVGHSFAVALPADEALPTDPSTELSQDDEDDTTGSGIGAAGDESDEAEEDDEYEEAEEGEEDHGDDDLGPEDGEEAGTDLLDEQGYDEL